MPTEKQSSRKTLTSLNPSYKLGGRKTSSDAQAAGAFPPRQKSLGPVAEAAVAKAKAHI